MKLTQQQEKEIMMMGERISTLIDEESQDWASEQISKEGEMTEEETLDRMAELCETYRNHLIKTTF